ncbi:16411_t:CDS:1 [Funneliformis mosseae]|uniref:16411_t:CDS:1 n=1 Tax=Funneliformis mosseae TaxID=27381 RepID=A0A9N9BBW3_FUNMO|nr:16411_t:CDS:1 [Funneliformis mosseae]
MVNTIPKQYALASRHGNITVNSLIIKPKHASILVNWIQRNNSNTRIPKDSKYNFKLIHRGSRDGYDIKTVRRRCVRKGACIVIIKSKENNTIIGGYNPLGWHYCDPQLPYHIVKYYWSSTTESFIFSLGDGKDLNNVKISRVVNSDNAIYEVDHENIPLNFGNSDLVINNNAGTCNQAHYECSILDTNNFTIEEMEIFKFIKGE